MMVVSADEVHLTDDGIHVGIGARAGEGARLVQYRVAQRLGVRRSGIGVQEPDPPFVSTRFKRPALLRRSSISPTPPLSPRRSDVLLDNVVRCVKAHTFT